MARLAVNNTHFSEIRSWNDMSGTEIELKKYILPKSVINIKREGRKVKENSEYLKVVLALLKNTAGYKQYAGHSNRAGIVGSNPTQGMHVLCVCVCSVCCPVFR
jgi:hypothetical protein